MVQLMKKHQNKLSQKKQDSSVSLDESENPSDSEDDDDDEDDDDQDFNSSSAIPSKRVIQQMGQQDKMEDEWLENDIPIEQLKEISEDEKKQNKSGANDEDPMKAVNKKKSSQNADSIQFQMKELTQAFQDMNFSLETNLKAVNDHIRDVQRGNLHAETPQLESLGKILGSLGKKLK